MISAVGKKDHAVLIDYRSLETDPVPFPPDTSVVVMDMAKSKRLVDSAYNQRRSSARRQPRISGSMPC